MNPCEVTVHAQKKKKKKKRGRKRGRGKRGMQTVPYTIFITINFIIIKFLSCLDLLLSLFYFLPFIVCQFSDCEKIC